MPEPTVTVRFNLDSAQLLSEARRAGDAVKNAMSGILTPLPMALGGQPNTLFEKASAAAKEHQAQVEKVDQSTKKLSESTKEVGRAAEQSAQSATRGGINVTAMIERMAVRLVVIKLIYDAIRAAGAAVTEATNWAEFSRRFETLSSSGAKATQYLQQFQQTAQRTGQSAEAIGNISLSFEAIGENADQAAKDTDALADAATNAAQPVEQLSKAFQQIKLGTATIDQMREFAFAIGGANSALLQQVNELQAEQLQLQRNEPIWNHIYELQRRATDEQKKHSDAVEEFGQHLKIGDNILQRMAAGASTVSTHLQIWQGGTQAAEINLNAAGSAMARMLQIGNQRIMQEEGISQRALKQLEQYGLINASFVLGAYHRQTEENRRVQEQQHEDAIYEARQQLTHRQLQIEQELTNEFESQNTVRKEGSQADQSGAEAWKQMEQAVANVARQLPELNNMVKDFANWVSQIAKQIDTTAVNQAIKDVSESVKEMAGDSGKFADNINRAFGFVQHLVEAVKAVWKAMGYDPAKAQRRLDWVEQAPGNIWKGLGDWFQGQAQKAHAALPEQFQHGGIVHRPTLAMIGEAGPEAVIPLGAYPQARDVIAGVAGQTFSTSPMPPRTDLSSQAPAMQSLLRGGGTLDPSDPRSPTYSRSAQAVAQRRLMAGGGAFGDIGGGLWGLLPPSRAPSLGPAPAARAPTPAPVTSQAPRAASLAPVSSIEQGLRHGTFIPGRGFMSGAAGGGGGGGGVQGPMTTHDEGTQSLLAEMISIFRTS